jgi:hypothetical protein
LSTVVPSPQFTVIEETTPSASVAVKVTVTGLPVLDGFGETPVTAATGGLSFIVSDATAPPDEPLLSLAVMVIVEV